MIHILNTYSKTFKALAAFSLLSTASTPAFALIDFETLPGGGIPTDDSQLTGSYTDDGVGVSFFIDNNGFTDGLKDASNTVNALFEASGPDGTDGFHNNTLRTNDTENNGVGTFGGSYSQGLGNFFLRTPDVVAQSDGIDGGLFVVEYDYTSAPAVATQASGQIWDIDGLGSRTEGWSVFGWYFNGSTYQQVASSLSPELNGNLASNSYDGQPWTFELTADSDYITHITIGFTGTKDSGVGLAFDNFNATLVPEPSTYAAIFGVLALGIALYRRRK